MTRLPTLLLLAAAASAAAAQNDAALAPAADAFRDDLRVVTNVVATAALVHDATGAFPTTPFALLGSREAGRTDLRATPLSALTAQTDGGRAVYEAVLLPTDPYVREDEVVRVTVYRGDDGLYKGDYEVRRREAAADGAASLPYRVDGRYRIGRGLGTACVDVATVRQRLAAGTYAPEPGALGPEGLTVRVVPPGASEPVYYQEGPGR